MLGVSIGANDRPMSTPNRSEDIFDEQDGVNKVRGCQVDTKDEGVCIRPVCLVSLIAGLYTSVGVPVKVDPGIVSTIANARAWILDQIRGGPIDIVWGRI